MYDEIARAIDAINDIVFERLSETEAREVMAREAEILKAVSQPWGDA